MAASASSGAGGFGLAEEDRVGVIHGRFQPFHNGHLEYLRLAAERSTGIVVGITNPGRDAHDAEPVDPARLSAESNPFTYWERHRMVAGVLSDEAIPHHAIVPFPIDEAQLLSSFVPRRAVHYLRVFDEWGREKVARLERAGFRVVILPGESKTVSGAEVRRRLQGGAWQELVPPGTARVLRDLEFG